MRGKPFEKGNKYAFKPGESGNPGGRPKLAILSDAYREQLAQELPNGQTFAELIATQMCMAAAKGDISAAREICDRVEGRARQSVDISAQVNWRELAAANDIDEWEVLREAERIIQSGLDRGRK